MAHPFTRCGGLFLWATQYIRPTRDIFNRMGSIANQALFNLVMTRLMAHQGSPVNGVFGDDFLVTEAGDGLLQVAPGMGLYHDDAASDPHGLAYRPFVSAQGQTLPVDESDATLDRVDVVSVAPAEVDDTPETLRVRSSGNLGPHEIQTRRRFSASIVVTKGVPGEAAPETPAGHVKLAEVRVLASGAGMVVSDHRPILTLGRDIRPVPGENHVVEGLEPSLLGPAAVGVAAGIADFGGRRVRFAQAGPFSPIPNATGATRYDLILAHGDGTIALTEGTGAQPTQADAPAGSLLLGYAPINIAGQVQATVDRRETGSIGPAQLRRGAVVGAIADGELTGAKLAAGTVTTPKLAAEARPVWVQLTHAGYNAGTGRHTIQVQIVDADGSPVARRVDLACIMRDQAWSDDSNTAVQWKIIASAPSPISNVSSRRLVRTGSDGSLMLQVEHLGIVVGSGTTAYFEVQPLGTPGGGGWVSFPVDAAP